MSEDEQPINPVSDGSPHFPPPPGPPAGGVPAAGPPPIVISTGSVPAADVPWTPPGPDTTWQPHTTIISTDPILTAPNYVEPAKRSRGKGTKIALSLS